MKKTQVSNFNAQHKAPKPETLVQQVALAFSYNPSCQPVLNRHGMKVSELHEWFSDATTIFKYMRNTKVEIYLEVSSAGRLHFHGRITPTNIIKFYILDLQILKAHGCSYEIDTIAKDEDWDKYIMKSRELMLPFCEKEGLAYPFLSE